MALRSLLRRLRKLLKLLPYAPYRRALKLGVAAAVEHESAMGSITFATLVDVGANIGQFSLLARTIHPAVVIHAFEPLSDMADRYERLFVGDRLTTLYRCAAGSVAGTTEINVSNHPDSSSLLPISARQSELFPGTQKVAAEEIEVVRVDDVLTARAFPRPILVKLDVQGFELEALRGMPRLLADARWVYVEVSFMTLYEGQPLADEICAWLAENGFGLVGVYNPTYSEEGISVQADMLFARSD